MSRLTDAHVAALDEMAGELREQGIVLEYHAGDELLDVRLRATDEGCADCLVPPPVMKAVIVQIVGDVFQESNIALQYPSETPTGSEERLTKS